MQELKDKVKKGLDEEADDGEPEVKQAFIVFRNTAAVEYIKEAYKYGNMEFYLIDKLGHLFCQKKKQSLKKLYFFKKFLKVRNAIEPDNINWQNLGYKKPYRKCMIVVNWVIAILILVICMLLIVLFKVTADRLKTGSSGGVPCPDDVSKTDAFDDY